MVSGGAVAAHGGAAGSVWRGPGGTARCSERVVIAAPGWSGNRPGYDSRSGAVLQLRWRTFTQLEAGLPGATDTTEPGTELLPGIDEATRHAHRQAWAAAIDRSRTLPTAPDLDISA
jgi:hypothetical protein